MIRRTFNRLWVRISVSIIAIVFVITVLPVASLLLVDEPTIAGEQYAYIEWLNTEESLGLSALQISSLAEGLTQLVQQSLVDDVQFLGITTLLVGIVGGILLGRGLSLSIEKLVRATKAVASQERNVRVDVRGAQEINDLADNFNQMVESLEHSEQIRRNMLADVSHELLTPLTVMQGNLRAILDDIYALDKEEIGKLYEQNKHLIRLVRDLRQVSQADAGQLEMNFFTVIINELVQETTNIFMPLAQEKQVTLNSKLAQTLPSVQADSHRLRQVLHNLLANALRHTPENGHITITTEQQPNEICIAITDTGDGIPPELLPHVFDRFYRADETHRRDSGGVGLGLAIAKGIVEGHNGRLTATSSGINQGSIFSIYLPIK